VEAAGAAALAAETSSSARPAQRADTAPTNATLPLHCTGSCAKQSYQAVLAVRNVGVECSDGLTFKDYTGGWRCAPPPELSACAPGFSNNTGSRAGIGMHCRQECPPWLVDCGDSCHMPGVHCSTAPQHLCPVVPLEGAWWGWCTQSAKSACALPLTHQHCPRLLLTLLPPRCMCACLQHAAWPRARALRCRRPAQPRVSGALPRAP
jgi:hypothetical protein